MNEEAHGGRSIIINLGNPISKKVDRLHCRNLPCMDIFVCKCAVLGGYMVTF